MFHIQHYSNKDDKRAVNKKPREVPVVCLTYSTTVIKMARGQSTIGTHYNDNWYKMQW